TIMPATSEAIATPAPQAAITPELAASELNAQVPAASLSLDEPAAIIEDDIAFVSPEVSQNSLADTSLAPDALSTTLTNDPVEEMMQSVNADQAESDLVSNEVDPDRILEGMVPAAAAEVTSSVLVEAVPVVQEPVIASAPDVEAIADEAPVVLDASQVTPEDAMAITAVAAATTQALSGTSPSEPVADTTKSKTGNSLEDSVKAMLKPMIKEWLDDNMPRILEGAIKDEVELPDNDKT
ncbi:MAG: DUF2497 domain-containing protein, partial [bacterium]|nr:DUF2497 domain-containing protein [bacterium]